MISSIRQSMLNLYCHCQEAFRRRYLENEIIPPAIAMATGTGVHRAAELNHRQKISSGMDLSIEEIQEAAAEGFIAEVEDKGVYFSGSAQELKKELGEAEDLSIKLARSYAQRIAPRIMPVAAELTLQAQHPDLAVPFSGTVDVVAEDNVCLDLKTARVKWRSGKEHETVQPAIYKWLLAEETGGNYAFGFHVLAYNGDTQYVPVESGEHEMAYVVNIARALLNSCKTGVFMPAVPGHWMCNQKFCGYWYGCKVRK